MKISSIPLTSQKLELSYLIVKCPVHFSQHLELSSPFQTFQSVTGSKQQTPGLSTELPSWRAAPPPPGHSGHLGQSPWLSARRCVPWRPDHHSQAPHTSSVLRQFCSLGRHIRSRNRRPLEASHRSAKPRTRHKGSERVHGYSVTAVQGLGGPRARVGGPQQGCLKIVFRRERGAES